MRERWLAQGENPADSGSTTSASNRTEVAHLLVQLHQQTTSGIMPRPGLAILYPSETELDGTSVGDDTANYQQERRTSTVLLYDEHFFPGFVSTLYTPTM